MFKLCCEQSPFNALRLNKSKDIDKEYGHILENGYVQNKNSTKGGWFPSPNFAV